MRFFVRLRQRRPDRASLMNEHPANQRKIGLLNQPLLKTAGVNALSLGIKRHHHNPRRILIEPMNKPNLPIKPFLTLQGGYQVHFAGPVFGYGDAWGFVYYQNIVILVDYFDLFFSYFFRDV